MIEFTDKEIPEINIGLIGHVDHGKTTLTQALTGKWTDTHSEEIKRGITIRLGYADASFYYCEKCKRYGTSTKCQKCFGDSVLSRTVSFIDAPGHETLMATVLSGAALMDGALLLVAANEKCPQPQTIEHMKVLDITGINKIVIVQNKVDMVSEERALENYNEIKEFVKGTVAENAPIIPISAVHNINIDSLIEAIETTITTPQRNLEKDAIFYIARSFDINKPGTPAENLTGAVVGGSLISGMLKKGDEIEIKPGKDINNSYKPLNTTITKIIRAGKDTHEAGPGGLVAIQTLLDPFLSRSDSLSGNICGLRGKMKDAVDKLKFQPVLFDHIIGIKSVQPVEKIKLNDILMVTVAISKTVGVVTSVNKGIVELKLKLPVISEKGHKIALSRQVGGRWHLIGYGILQ